MRLLSGLVVLLAMLSSPAVAGTYTGCDRSEAAIISQSLDDAKTLTLKAASAVGDTPEYVRWFGTYDQRNAERVRATLKSIVTAIRAGAVTAQCEIVAPGACNSDEYAYVYTDNPYLLHLCPNYFDLPSLTNLRPGTRRSDFGTREGTIVHELSHFLHVAGTDDHCYSRSDCSAMAQRDSGLAIENADSYQYFTEDVTYYARQPLADKPPAAPVRSR